jgi:hypothetical protein
MDFRNRMVPKTHDWLPSTAPREESRSENSLTILYVAPNLRADNFRRLQVSPRYPLPSSAFPQAHPAAKPAPRLFSAVAFPVNFFWINKLSSESGLRDYNR